MSRIKNKDDLVQYCIRLNLNNPEHLEVHKILQGLNKDVHKSQNNFIIQSVLRNAKCYSIDEMMTDAAKEQANNGRFVTQGEFERNIELIKTEIARDVFSQLCASLAKGNSVIDVKSENKLNSPYQDNKTEDGEVDTTLEDLSKMWA